MVRRPRFFPQFRPWTKKRGRRSQTGTLGGTLGEMAFYVGLILLGVFTLSLIIITQVMMPRMNVDLPDEARRMLQTGLTGGGHYGRWVVVVASIAAIGSGTGGVIYRLSQLAFSQERLLARASERSSKTQRDRDVESHDDSYSLPWVPQFPPHSNSPGERLAIRLASSATGRWTLFGSASLALAWNTVCVVLLAVVVSGWLIDQNRPILGILLVPFFGIAIWALRSFTKRLRQLIGVGPTLVEISDHPLQPGGEYDLFVSQMGRVRLNRLSIRLVCEEETYFREGTDVRAEKYEAFSRELLVSESVRVDPRRPWEQQLTLAIPRNAMHSFVATHNAVRWRLIISGESRPWPSFCRSFPLLVYPPLMAPPAIPR